MLRFRTPPSIEKIITAIAFVGALSLALGAWFYATTSTFVADARRTEGVVTALRSGYGYETWPVVTFRPETGPPVTFQSLAPSRTSPRYPIGTRVGVLYDRNDPSHARIDAWVDVWGLAGFWLLFGGGVSALAAFMMTISWRMRQRAR